MPMSFGCVTVSYTFLHSSQPPSHTSSSTSLQFLAVFPMLVSFLHIWWFQYIVDDPSKRPSISVSWFLYSIDIFLFHFSHSLHLVTPWISTSLKKYKPFQNVPIETLTFPMAAPYVFSGHKYFHTITQFFRGVGTSIFSSLPFLLPTGPFLPSPLIWFSTDSHY